MRNSIQHVSDWMARRHALVWVCQSVCMIIVNTICVSAQYIEKIAGILYPYRLSTWFDKTFTHKNNVEGNTSSILILLFVTHYLFYFYFTYVVCVCCVCFRPVSKWVSGINELQVHKYMCCHTNFISFWINICCELEIDFSSFYLFIAFMSEMCTLCCRCICSCKIFSTFMHSIKFELIAAVVAHIYEIPNE